MQSFLRKKMNLRDPAHVSAAVILLQKAYDRNPEKFTNAYEVLLKDLAERQLLESTIRKEILHSVDEPSYFSALKAVAASFFPRETGLATSLLDYIEWFRNRKENGYPPMSPSRQGSLFGPTIKTPGH